MIVPDAPRKVGVIVLARAGSQISELRGALVARDDTGKRIRISADRRAAGSFIGAQKFWRAGLAFDAAPIMDEFMRTWGPHLRAMEDHVENWSHRTKSNTNTNTR